MKQKIKEVLGTKPFDSKFGQMFNIKVRMEDGTEGSISAKTQDKYKAGDEIDYTVETKEYNGNTYNTFKVVQPTSGFGGGKSYVNDINEKFVGFSFSYVKDLIVAGKCEVKDFRAMSKSIALEMKSLYKEMKSND